MANERIMVVEDEWAIADDIQKCLKNLGYTVSSVAASGEKAVQRAEEHKPDLILMDIALQGEMDGIEAASQINSRFNIPVIYLTAYADKKVLERAKLTGPFGYLIKPFEENELYSTIEMAFYKHKMEMKIKESEEKFRAISTATFDSIIMMDNEGKVSFWNKAAEKMFGYLKEESVGEYLHKLIVHKRYHEDYLKGFETFKVTGQGPVFEKVLTLPGLKKDGTEFYGDYSFSAIKIKDKWHAISTIRDITERKKAEEQILKLSRAIEYNPCTILITDAGGVIEYVNPKFIQLTGYSFEEAIGQNPRILKSGKTPPEVYKDLWKTIKSGNEWRGEFSNRKKNGELYWESASISPVKNTEGVITHFVAVKEDISEKKGAE